MIKRGWVTNDKKFHYFKNRTQHGSNEINTNLDTNKTFLSLNDVSVFSLRGGSVVFVSSVAGYQPMQVSGTAKRINQNITLNYRNHLFGFNGIV